MIETIHHGGPAFPLQRFDGPRGMTLRDYFAGQALIRLITWEDGAIRPACDAALMAYDYADAMLKEREK